MDKSDYQKLRFAVECHIAGFISDPAVASALCNELMRQFVTSISASVVKQAAAKRSFVTFRRDVKTTLPTWASRKPGIDSRLPRF